MKRFALFSNPASSAPIGGEVDTQVNEAAPISSVSVKVEVSKRPHILKQRNARRARRAAV